MRVKKFSIFILLLLLKCNFTISQWTWQNPPLQENNLNSVYFINYSTGWVSGIRCLLKTTDGGSNWINQYPDTNGFYNLSSFINSQTGWLIRSTYGYAPSYTKIYQTQNGGNNWQFLSNIYDNISSVSLQAYLIYGIDFVNENTGFICGTRMMNFANQTWNEGVIARTTDGGLNWNYTAYYNSYYIFDIKFINQYSGWAVGINNLIIKTTNSGSIWNYIQGAYTNNMHYNSISIVNENMIFILSYNGSYRDNAYFSKTTNGGVNWTGQFLISGKNLYGIDFVNENSGWITGASGTVIATSNSGVNWNNQVIPTNKDITCPYFINNDTGWIVGNNGTILKTNSGIVSAVNNNTELITEKYELFQNYPNPFNPVTKIRFSVPEFGKWKDGNGIITMKVYDLLGKEIAVLVNDKFAPGVYEATFDASKYSSGVYFYQLAINDKQLAIKKMVLIK
jgi:photosystem II stability/assembly factor-like uncharacterized protein